VAGGGAGEEQQPQTTKRRRALLEEEDPASTASATAAIAAREAAEAASASSAAHERALLPRAWQLTRGSPRVLVAHVDTGVDFSPALSSSQLPYSPLSAFRGRLWSNPLEAAGGLPGVDDDGNGYGDDVGGVAFLGQCVGDTYDDRGYCMECGPTGDVSDLVGHGTHTAGIIASRPEEEVEAQRAGDFSGGEAGAGGGGGALFAASLSPSSNTTNTNTTNTPIVVPRGVAPGARLLPLKVSDCADGVIWASGVFRAFDYALKAGAQIVSCSFSAVFPDGFGALNITTGGGSVGLSSPPVAAAALAPEAGGGGSGPAVDNAVGSNTTTTTTNTTKTTPPAPPSEREWARAYSAALAPLARAGVLVVAAAGNNRADLDALSRLGYTDYPCFGQQPGLNKARALAALEGGGLSSQEGAISAANNGSAVAPVGGGGVAAPAATDSGGIAGSGSSLETLYWSGTGAASGPMAAVSNPDINNADPYGTLGFPNVVCVGAVADRDEVPPGIDPSSVAAPYSNFGSRSVALAAPGTVGSTRAGGGYGVQRGTSMAAPLVSGTAALALSVLGALTGNYTGRALELRAALLAGSLPMPAPPRELAEEARRAAAEAAAAVGGASANETAAASNSSSNGTATAGANSTTATSPPRIIMTGAAVDSAEPPFGARLDAEASIRWIVERYAPPGMVTTGPLVPSSLALLAKGEGEGAVGQNATATLLQASSSGPGRVLALRGLSERMEYPSNSSSSSPGSVRLAQLPMGGLNLDGWGDDPAAVVVVGARVALPEPGVWALRAASVTRPPPPPPPDAPAGLSLPPPPPGALLRASVRINGKPTAARPAAATASPSVPPGAAAAASAGPYTSSSSSSSTSTNQQQLARVAAGDGVEAVFVATAPGVYAVEVAVPAADGASAASLDLSLKAPSGAGFARLSPGGDAFGALAAARTPRGADPAAPPVPLVPLAAEEEREAARDAALRFGKAAANLSSPSSPSPSPSSFAVYYNWTTLPEAEADPSVRPMLAPTFEGMAAGAMAVRRSPRAATVELARELPTYARSKVLKGAINFTDPDAFQRFLDPMAGEAIAANTSSSLPPPPLVLARGVAVGAFRLPATDSGVALVSFRVLCRGCALAVDGQLVLDAWATAGTQKGLNTRSDCVALTTAVRRREEAGEAAAKDEGNDGPVHSVALTFAPPPTADGRTLGAPLALSIAPCGGGGGGALAAAEDEGGRDGASPSSLSLPRVVAGALNAGEAALVAAGPAVPVGATLAAFRPLEANATTGG
jgi:hypothetical protein